MLDLPQKYQHMIQKILSTEIPDMEVWAYGSRVNGKSHEGSDLDLVIINPSHKNQPQKNIARLRELFSESKIPILIDLHDWAELPEDFKKIIQENYIILQKSS